MHERLDLPDEFRGFHLKLAFVDHGAGVLIHGNLRHRKPKRHFVGYWDTKTGRYSSEGLNPVGSDQFLCFSANGRHLLIQKRNKRVYVRDRISGETTDAVTYPQNPFELSDDGRTTMSDSRGGMTAWDTATGESRGKIKSDHRRCRLSPNGKYALYGSTSCAVAHDLESGREVGSLPAMEAFGSMSPDSRSFLYTYHYRAKLFDLATGEERESLVAPFELIGGGIDQTNSKIAVGGCAPGIRIWSLPSEDILAEWNVPDRYTRELTFDTDTPRLVTASDSGVVRLWDLVAGREMASLILFSQSEWVTITPDGHFIGSENVAGHARWQLDGSPVEHERYAKQFHRPRRVAASLKLTR